MWEEEIYNQVGQEVGKGFLEEGVLGLNLKVKSDWLDRVGGGEVIVS